MSLKTQSLFYVGIIRDCGAFMHENTTSETHRIVAQMIDNGINHAYLNEHFMKTTSLKSIILQKHALSTMKILCNNKVCIMHIPLNVFQQENCTIDDVAPIVSIGNSIEGIELSIMASEIEKNTFKISFRSKSSVDVSKLAQKFNGGGHMRASGCKLIGTIDSIEKQILNEAKSLFE